MKKLLLPISNLQLFSFLFIFFLFNYSAANGQDNPKVNTGKETNSSSQNHSSVQTSTSSASSEKKKEKKKKKCCKKKEKGTEIKHQSSNQHLADSLKSAKDKEKGIK